MSDLFAEEHWWYEKDINTSLSKYNDKYMVVSNCGMNERHDIHMGRTYGGTGILYGIKALPIK